MCAARSRAHCSGSASGQPLLGEVEVLDAEHGPGSRALRGGAAPRRSRPTPRRIVDVHLRVPALALAELHVIGEIEQLARVAAPVGHVTGVDEQPQLRHLGAERAHRLGRVHDRARPRLEQTAGRRAPPAYGRVPTCRRPSLGAGVAHQPGCGFGNAVGQPIGSASDAGSVPSSGSMCSKPSAAAAAARAANVAPPCVHDVDDAERPAQRHELLAASTSA